MTQVITGNVYDKYGTQNPIARRLVGGFLRTFRELLEPLPVWSILEVGCGEGRLMELSARVKPSTRIVGIDLEFEVFDPHLVQNSRLCFSVQSTYDLAFPDASFDLVVAAEVLEHLEDPEAALKEIARVSKRFVLLSVPREPLWRMLNLARLSYVGSLGNTPGHLQHWSRTGFVELVGKRFDVMRVRSPLPWTMVLGRKSR